MNKTLTSEILRATFPIAITAGITGIVAYYFGTKRNDTAVPQPVKQVEYRVPRDYVRLEYINPEYLRAKYGLRESSR